MSSPCSEPIVAHLLAEDGTVNCQNWYAISCESEMPCTGAAFWPWGDLQPFALERKLTGLVVDCSAGFVVTDDHPDLDAIFLDGEAVLRLRRVNIQNLRCHDGLSGLTGVTVRIYYDAAMATESTTWSALKAGFR